MVSFSETIWLVFLSGVSLMAHRIIVCKELAFFLCILSGTSDEQS